MFIVFLMFWLPLLVLCSVVFSNGVSLYEGDNCQNSNRNGEHRGKCLSAYKCAWALEQIQQRHHVDICCFRGKIPIVCCPMNQIMNSNEVPLEPNPVQSEAPKLPPKKPIVASANPSASGAPLKEGLAGNLSRSKCEEYFPRPEGFHTVAVGGKESLAAEFPHMAVLGFGTDDDKQWKCGGSLISLQHVLTAAHCLYSRDLGEVKYVRLGDLNINVDTDDAEPQDFTVKRIIPHPNYESRAIKHDIAIIELDRPVKLTKYVKPGCLQLAGEIDEYSVITATGWGLTEFAGAPSSHLIKVELQIVGVTDCRKQYSRNGPSGNIDDNSQVCAASASDEKIMDTCEGDSGGPLQQIDYTNQKHYRIIGVTSFGKACGVSKSPGVYTRVSNYLSWIEPIVFQN